MLRLWAWIDRSWRAHEYELHQKNIASSKSREDRGPPKAMQFRHMLKNNAKARYFKAIRQEEVVKENDRLLTEVRWAN